MQLSVTLLQVMGLYFQEPTSSLFVRLLSHQPAVLFSQNKSAPAISHQPNEQTEGRGQEEKCREHVSR
jgi:hypothetical protein